MRCYYENYSRDMIEEAFEQAMTGAVVKGLFWHVHKELVITMHVYAYLYIDLSFDSVYQ